MKLTIWHDLACCSKEVSRFEWEENQFHICHLNMRCLRDTEAIFHLFETFVNNKLNFDSSKKFINFRRNSKEDAKVKKSLFLGIGNIFSGVLYLSICKSHHIFSNLV